MEGSWKKSSYSSGADNCVELAQDEQGLLVRDSKGDLTVMLSFTDVSAAHFRSAVKVGRFDH